MICIIALVVFAFLGIFSATHRQLAKEAFDCVFRKITLRKCETGLDVRLKSAVTGRMMAKSPLTAKFLHRHFELFSWLLVILMIASLCYSIYGGYNYYLYGSCYGPEDSGFCIFDPTGHNEKFSTFGENFDSEACSLTMPETISLTLDGVNLKLFQKKYSENSENKNRVFFIGCYACPYTRDIADSMKKLSEQNVHFMWAHFPVKETTNILSKYGNCIYEQGRDKFWDFHDTLFKLDADELQNTEKLDMIAVDLGISKNRLKECVNSEAAEELVKLQIGEIQKTGIYGTPTVFINDAFVVGPKPYRVYSRMLD